MADPVAEQPDLREEVRRLRKEQEELKERLRQQSNGHGGDGAGKSPQSGEQGEQSQAPPQQSPEKKDEKKKRSWFREHPLGAVILLIVLIVPAIAGFFLWQYLSSYESTDDAEIDAHINAVTARIAGTVVGVYVENNQMVKAGQTLVDLDPRDYKVSLEQDQAALVQAQASTQAQNPNIPITETTQATQVTTATEDVTNAEAALAGAQQSYQSAVAQLRQAEANYQNAAADEVRYKQLVAKDEVSKEQYDQKATAKVAQQAIVDAQRASADAAKQQIAQRQAALAQARQRLSESRQNLPRAVEIQRAQLASKQADAQRAKANVDQALLNLSYTKIAAPVNGVVGRRSAEVGQQVSPGQQLMGITNLDDVWVTANFKETQLRNMKPGQSARIHVDALNANFDGYVDSLPGASGARYSLLPPENATGNYVKVVQRLPVRIRFKSEQSGMERLRPGMSVEPKVYIR